MAIVCRHGKHDFLITFTANPGWPEVLAPLRPGERPHDRPDIIARVFYLKLKQLHRELFDLHVLGVATAWVWVVEFQKRGLPLCHIVLNVRPEDKIRHGDDVDRRVCAECPPAERTDQTALRDIVRASLVHGPCGPGRNMHAPCMEEGRCVKNYPKAFQEHTTIAEGSYPEYRRRDTRETWVKGGKEFDNRDIVPYNPYLARRFEAHINVEVVTSVKSLKYLFKCTFKGHDRAALELHQGDEVATHVDARYVGPAEGCWRIFGYPLHAMSHHVERLAVHLPDMQHILFEEGSEREALQAGCRQTTLTAWFALNAASTAFRHVSYVDIPEHCVWHAGSRTWKKRYHGAKRVVGRLCGASPAEGERYFLYLLLLHVPGAQSFEALRCVQGHPHPATSFREAATWRGLLHDDSAYADALAEAQSVQMPRQMRIFFAHLLLACDVTDASHLWTTFRTAMAEDFENPATESACEVALADIQQILGLANKKTSDFGLPLPKSFSLETFQNRDL